MPDHLPPLNSRQDAFVREYLLSGNASAAYVKAGYAPKHADGAGPRLLGNVGVAAHIAHGRKKIVAKAEAQFDITLDRVLEEYARIAFSGMSKFLRISPNGDPIIDLSDCTPADLDLLAETTVEDFTDGRGKDARDIRRVKVKLLDRMNALEKLGKHLGLSDKRADEGVTAFAQALRDIAQRGSSMPIASQGDEDDEIEP